MAQFFQLKRVTELLRIDLGLNDPLALGWSSATPGHFVKPQKALDVNEIVHMEKIVAETDNSYVTAAVGLALICLYAVVRPIHVQRSKLIKEHKDFYVFYCAAGKRRVNGQQPPFVWCLYKGGLLRGKADRVVVRKIVQCFNPDPPLENEHPYLFRSYGPSTADPIKAKYWLPQPLTPAAAQRGRVQIMMLPELSLTEEAARQVQAYRGRHVPTTWAPSAKMDPDERAALSNWKDIKDDKAKEVTLSMGHLYSQSKVWQSAVAKFLFIESLADTIEVVNNYNLTWAQYAEKAVPVDSSLRTRAAAAAADVVTDEGDTEARKLGAQMLMKPSDTLEDNEQPTDSSSSDSSSSSESEGAQELLHRKLNTGSTHYACYSTGFNGSPVHLCGPSTESPIPDSQQKFRMLCPARIFSKNAEFGIILEIKLSMGARRWCDKCRLKAPDSVSSLVLD